MPLLTSPYVSIYDLLAHVEDTLFQIWKETGFGHIELDSSKIGQDATQVIFRSSTHHYYTFRNQDVSQLVCRKSIDYPYVINHEFFTCFEHLLLRVWQESGFGKVAINSTRIKQNKIRLIVQGSPYYRYVIDEQDIKEWGSAFQKSK